jgi:hypothetical protein
LMLRLNELIAKIHQYRSTQTFGQFTNLPAK